MKGLERGRALKKYELNIVYSYNINSQKYISNRYYLESNIIYASDDYEIKSIADRYEPEKENICYINPDNPGKAVLEKGIQPAEFFALCVMSVFLLLPLLLCAFDYFK